MDGNTGTPGTRRDIVVSFRLTEAEAARVDAAAAEMKPKRTRPDWCRAAACHIAKAKVPAPPPPRRHPARNRPTADIEALGRVLANLGRICAHTNQLAHVANASGKLPEVGELRRITLALEAVRDHVRTALEG